MTTATTPTQASATQAAPSTNAETDSPVAPPAEGSLDAAILEAASVDEAAAEVEAPAEAAPVTDKLTLAAETLKKARKIAKGRREAIARAERETLRADTFAKQLEQERQETARAREEREAFKKDPLAAIKKQGVSARDLAQAAINEGTPEARMAALQAQVEEERGARLALEQRWEREKLEGASRTAQETFFAHIKPETHPSLARLDRAVVMSFAQHEFAKAQKNGHTPTDRQVLDWCESLLSAPPGASAGTSTPKTNPGTTVAKPVAKPSPTSRTVTADLAGRRYTAPVGIENLDPQAQKDALAKMLEEGS